MMKESNEALEFLIRAPIGSQTMVTKKQLQEIVQNTHARVMSKGCIWKLKKLHWGAGMYEIWLE